MVSAKRIIDGKKVFVAGPVLFDEYGDIPIWTDIESGEEYKESELIFSVKQWRSDYDTRRKNPMG